VSDKFDLDGYVIVQREDYEDLKTKLGSIPGIDMGKILPLIEGFVLRPTDVFAPSALHATANAVVTFLELAHMADGQVVSDEETNQLAKYSAKLTELALDWSKRQDRRPRDV
jgi:hypothetical protein